uniref:Target of Myb protein 1 n=1 Tax=Aceria tosichella TaxID=561515 RepID=A0A6G1S8X8_9ACAR
MSDLLQIFSGNPLTSFVGKKVEAATRPDLESEDWALNIEICDIINENDDDAKDAARAIKKRLQTEPDSNFIITNRTLTLLDTCVSNCSHRFHALVMTKDFIQDLVKLIGPKNNPPIELQERVLGLIERWADAFRNQPDLGGVVSVYNDLKAKGVTFPARDSVPVQTPQRSVPIPPSQETRPQILMPRPGSGGAVVAPARQQPPGQVVLEGDGYNKISQDLIVVQTSIEMFTDILKELESPTVEETVWNLADELGVTCRQMKDRIVDLIERVANEDLTIELLRLNDELNNIFTKYERIVKNRAKMNLEAGASTQTNKPPLQNQQVGPAPNPKLPGVSSRTLNDLSLIDFKLFGPGESGSSQQPQPQQQTNLNTPMPRTIPDPFDTSNIPTGKEQSLADSLSKISLDTPSGVKGAAKVTPGKGKADGSLPEEISSVREQDFAEIENWLSTDSGRNLNSIAGDMPSVEPISIPNSEFENFIASRALAGSDNSSSQQQETNRDKQKKPEPSV